MKHLHIAHIVSQVENSLSFEWLAVALHKQYKVTFILLNRGSSALEKFLLAEGIEVKRINFSGKADYLKSFITLWFFLLRRRPDIVHAHLLHAQLLGLTAAWMAGINKRIYTRHNSNFHHIYFPLAVLYDKWSNRLATRIVSLSQATDYTLLELEQVPSHKIRKIPHGFHLSEFLERDKEKMNSIKTRWHIPDAHPCIGVIARHIEWKGVQFIIPAFMSLLKDYPRAVLVLANCHGPYHFKVLQQLSQIPQDNYVLIPFEEDIVSLYALFDIFIHVPVDKFSEAFGQTFVEALAAEIPSVFSRSGIAAEFIEHKKNAWVVNFCDSDAIYTGMKAVLKDIDLQEKLKKEGGRSVAKLFSFDGMMQKLKKLYDE